MPNQHNCKSCGNRFDLEVTAGCPVCQLQVGLSGSSNPSSLEMIDAAELSEKFDELEVIEVLGAGGMGAVYLARQLKLDRLVALKVIRSDISDNSEFATRFEREARALARLNHANIVNIYDFGCRDGLYFYLMEYVDGTSLAELAAAQSMTPAEALQIVADVCNAIQFAHDNGVVHRDIKPTNILVNTSGDVKIADFGLAKLNDTESTDTQLTQTQQVFGTPRYMAPEQIESSREVDHRADIYSLGVVFYELLTGELPIGRFDPPSKRVEVDVRLDEVVLRALEKHPERRYQSAREMQTDIGRYIANEPAPPVKRQRNPAFVPTRTFDPNLQERLSRPSALSVLLQVSGSFLLFAIAYLFPLLISMISLPVRNGKLFWSFVLIGSILSAVVGGILLYLGLRRRKSVTYRDLSPVQKLFSYRVLSYGTVVLVVSMLGSPWLKIRTHRLFSTFVTAIETWNGLSLFIVMAIALLLLLFIDAYEGTSIRFAFILFATGLVVCFLIFSFLTKQGHWLQLQLIHGFELTPIKVKVSESAVITATSHTASKLWTCTIVYASSLAMIFLGIYGIGRAAYSSYYSRNQDLPGA